MKSFLLFTLIVGLTVPHTLICKESKEPKKVLTQDEFDEMVYSWTRSFAEILQLTNQKHYKVTDIQECMIKALDGFLNCLDPHTNLLDPKTYKNMLDMTSGEFYGIGIVIDNTRSSKDKFLLVIDTIPEGPADKAGIKPLDKIIEVNGEGLDGMTTDEITAKLKGEKGTQVEIKVLREHQIDLLTFDITRDVIKEQTSTSFYLPDQDIYYLSLTTFSEPSARQLEALLKKAHDKNARGIILDLRNNSGGLLTSVIDIAGLFVDKGSVVVTTKDKHDKVVEHYKTTRTPISVSSTPICILINNFTASAAEILAGCLRIHAEKKNQMVFLVGTKSFGKGSVQEVVPISNNCAIKITTTLYFLPDDTTIQGIGITPDFEIERRFPMTEQQKWFTQSFGREQALQNYIQVHELDTKKDVKEKHTVKNRTQRMQEMLENDNQLRETISIMNLLGKAQSCCPKEVKTRSQARSFINDVFILSNKKLNLTEVKN